MKITLSIVCFTTMLFGVYPGRNSQANIKHSRFIQIKNAEVPTNLLIQTEMCFTRLLCTLACIHNTMCAAYSYSQLSQICRLFQEEFRSNSHTQHATNTTAAYYNWKYCKNGGRKIFGVCMCVNSFVGETCERLMTDCSDGLHNYFGEDGIFTVKPNSSSQSFQVRCIMDSRGMVVIQSREFGNVSFDNRSWIEYKEGFGDPSYDHWLGNEKIFQLSNRRTFGLLVEIDLMSSTNTSTSTKSIDYPVFKIYGEPDRYKLHIPYTPEYDIDLDCFSKYNGFNFSTKDVDNDMLPGINCAVNNMSGWWYGTKCSDCNLNGRLKVNVNGTRKSTWAGIPSNVSMISTRMKMYYQALSGG